MKWLRLTIRVACIIALVLVVPAFLAVQFQQNLLRWRAKRLLADIHQIKLHQSTWADAQRLMRRWGAWGHYDGSCTVTDCRYEITLINPSMYLSRLRWFGGRLAVMNVGFIVQDGSIWRTSTALSVDVPPRPLQKASDEYLLIISTKSRDRLEASHYESGSVFGSDEQLAEHPNYKAGGPAGCMNCIKVDVNYSTQTPQSEILGLTDFDLSCLTRLSPCTTLEELLPAVREWPQYAYSKPSEKQIQHPDPSSNLSCNLPLWALGRDAVAAFVVEAIPTPAEEKVARQQEHSEFFQRYESAKVRIVEQLKGEPFGTPGMLVVANTSPGYPNEELPEHLEFGKRYILLPFGVDPDDRSLFMKRCGVQDDTSDVRKQLETGFELNDRLRGPELPGKWWF